MEPAPYRACGRIASAGARGLIGAGLGLAPEADGIRSVARRVPRPTTRHPSPSHSRLFDGVPALLQGLERARHGLGHRHQQGDALHRPAGAADRPWTTLRCVVSGDTMPIRSRTRRRCLKPRSAAGRRRQHAGTWVTTCAISRPDAPPAWSPSPPHGATAAATVRHSGMRMRLPLPAEITRSDPANCPLKGEWIAASSAVQYKTAYGGDLVSTGVAKQRRAYRGLVTS